MQTPQVTDPVEIASLAATEFMQVATPMSLAQALDAAEANRKDDPAWSYTVVRHNSGTHYAVAVNDEHGYPLGML
jgi:hypothetical protein